MSSASRRLTVESSALIEEQGWPVPEGQDEAFRGLVDLAPRIEKIPPELLALHVLRVTPGADWPVQRAAMEALVRRWGFARRDELRVASRPAQGAVLGRYGTKGRGASRPYQTQLTSLDPLEGSCDCPDYLKSSLGLCKHLLAVLAGIGLGPQRIELARREQEHSEAARGPRLRWDPVRPLTGAGDPLERLFWVEGAGREPGGRVLSTARRWFGDKRGGEARLRDSHASAPAQRLRMVRELLRLLESTAHRRGAGSWSSDPSVGAILRAEEVALGRAVAGEPLARRLPAALRSLRRELYAYQVEGVRAFLERGRLLLADDMGLGKTAQAIAACHALYHSGRVRRGLLLVPASLKPQWHREWRLFSSVPVEVVDGSPAQRAATYRRMKQGYLIANYEQLLRDLPLMHRWAPDLVVLDEAQRIKNWATKTSTYVKQLRPDYRLVLTGTPMENRLDELASLMDFVDEQALEPKWRLAPWHSITVDGSREVAGARNLETLRSRLEGRMLRRLRHDVLDQLPARTDTRVPVDLTADQREAHAELDLPIARIVAMARRRPLTQAEFLRLMSLLTTQRIICNGMAQLNFKSVWPGVSTIAAPDDALLRSLSSPKLVELRELIANVAIEQRRKVVVFSQWRRMLELANWGVGDLLARARIRAVFFTGEESQRRRTQNLVDFHDDSNTRVLFATDAGGVGLNLQRAATCCINIELPWNPAVLEQRIGRIHRLGQKSPIDVYCLVSESGIESRILDLVGNKKALFSGLFDGSSDQVLFERSGSFLSRVEKLVEPVVVPDLDEAATEESEQLLQTEVLPGDERPLPLSEVVTPTAAGPVAPPVVQEGKPTLVSVPVPPGGDIVRLLGQLSIRRAQGGGVTIEAPAEAATALAAVLRGLAQQIVGELTL